MRSSSSEGTWRSPLETPNLDLHPVVVGQGRFTLHRNGRPQGRDGLVSPLQLMTKAVALAAEDAGLRSLVSFVVCFDLLQPSHNQPSPLRRDSKVGTW